MIFIIKLQDFRKLCTLNNKNPNESAIVGSFTFCYQLNYVRHKLWKNVLSSINGLIDKLTNKCNRNDIYIYFCCGNKYVYNTAKKPNCKIVSTQLITSCFFI